MDQVKIEHQFFFPTFSFTVSKYMICHTQRKFMAFGLDNTNNFNI